MASQQVIGIFMLFVCLVNGRSLTTEFEHAPDHLELLHVLFRHGDRTPAETYPNDPYENYTYYPVGLGQLTNAGKTREYNIGGYLRHTYDDFLGDTYFPEVLGANASPLPRTKASMQLALAALYPPSNIERWSTSLDWQPIPYDYTKQSENYIFWSTSACSKYAEYQATYENSTAYEQLYEPYSDVLDYLQESSGITSRSFLAGDLYSTLRSQQEWGLELPAWSDSVWPEPITTITKLDWQQWYATEETRAIGAGFLMSQIVNDTQLTIDGDSSVEDTKIYLYAGHDSNIAAVLSWLGTPDLHIPQYGSFIVFEIHNIEDVRYLRIVHQNYEYNTPHVVYIPDCGYYCEFDTFVSLYSKYINPYDLCN